MQNCKPVLRFSNQHLVVDHEKEEAERFAGDLSCMPPLKETNLHTFDPAFPETQTQIQKEFKKKKINKVLIFQSKEEKEMHTYQCNMIDRRAGFEQLVRFFEFTQGS